MRFCSLQIVKESGRASSCYVFWGFYEIIKGKIQESGTHGELLRKEGAYAHLWTTQQGERPLGPAWSFENLLRVLPSREYSEDILPLR
ncbi:hypothetical protein DSTSK_40510 [Desulforhabdus sp. TSK]|nr:hypothetical protein DSTSK_40510 [Desulforhabdus sp. TSK]